jgi:DNA-binding MarR family transcriptional regulator
LVLTPHGQEQVRRIQKTISALENEIFKKLSHGEISQMGNFISRLESAMNEIDLQGEQ